VNVRWYIVVAHSHNTSQEIVVSDLSEEVEEARAEVSKAIEEKNRARSHEQALIDEANKMAEEYNLDKVRQEYGARIGAAIEETASAENRVTIAMKKSREAWKRHRKSHCPPILD